MTSLRTTPRFLSSLHALQKLNLSWNSISSCTELSAVSNLIKLVMISCHLVAIPDCLQSLSKLQTLDLSNEIADIPACLPWSNLQILALYSNRLTQLPWKALLSVPRLQQLDCSSNRMQVIYFLCIMFC